MTVHLLDDDTRLLPLAEGEVRPLEVPDLRHWADEIPEDVRAFLESALSWDALAAAAFADGRPVSFCCAADETESLWDISIDTLEGHRRKGHAARCVSWMVAEMRRCGKEPVWAAEDTNSASLHLAIRLGFVPVDELVLFRPAS